MRYGIVRVKLQKNKERLNLYFGNGQYLGISAFLFGQSNLEIGSELDADDIYELIQKDFFERGKSKSLNLLSYRPRSSSEIKKRLSRYYFKISGESGGKSILSIFSTEKIKNCADNASAQTLDWLKEKNFINDHDFASWWINSRISGKPTSKRMIYYELRKKGIDKGVIDSIINKIDLNEVESARKLYLKRASRRPLGLTIKDKQKTIRWLAGKGFSYDVIREAIDGKE
jgi:regulatory protein